MTNPDYEVAVSAIVDQPIGHLFCTWPYDYVRSEGGPSREDTNCDGHGPNVIPVKPRYGDWAGQAACPAHIGAVLSFETTEVMNVEWHQALGRMIKLSDGFHYVYYVEHHARQTWATLHVADFGNYTVEDGETVRVRVDEVLASEVRDS